MHLRDIYAIFRIFGIHATFTIQQLCKVLDQHGKMTHVRWRHSQKIHDEVALKSVINPLTHSDTIDCIGWAETRLTLALRQICCQYHPDSNDNILPISS